MRIYLRSKQLKPLPEHLRQWGLHIQAMEPCWMTPYGSSDDFAHIGIILSNGHGSKYYLVFLPCAWV
jgi:hypothetical protein